MKSLMLGATALAALSIIGTAHAGDAAAARADMECVRDKVIKLDDGRMDPRALATIIQPLCHAEHEMAMQAQEGWKVTPEKRRQDVEFMHTWAAVLWVKN